ncbi:hypothetical protein GCM10009839_65490 [Catenulispora yoronensis]|uniref:DUF202 domain-containing protein n=1 Tax=Catenulispora yoronensis TaxID=450799 RepID=A0ABP5GNZ2_9ACTN
MAGTRPVGDPRLRMERRIEHIEALAADIATQQRVALKLLSSTVRVFYTFFVLACLTIGVAAFLRGNHNTAVTWGGTGIILGFVWVVVFAGNKVSRRAFRQLKAELTGDPSDASDAADTEGSEEPVDSESEPQPEPVGAAPTK